MPSGEEEEIVERAELLFFIVPAARTFFIFPT